MSATERVGIEIDLMGYEEALRSMQNLERELKSLSGHKVRIDAQNRLKDLERNARGLRAELERIKSIRPDEFVGPMQEGNTAAKTLKEQMKAVRQEMSQTNAEAQRIRSTLKSVKPLRQVFNGISSGVAHMGSAMQSAGNAIQRLMTPLRMLGTGALLGAGYKAMNTVSEGLSKGLSRYDTMKKYPKVMQSFGYSAKQAQKSIDALDKSVRGLPTGLDEMVDMAQRFTATTGDIEKGTDLAIAANNAFLASMSTDTQKYQGMMQLQDVLGGKDMNAREWNSLVSSMTPAIVKMGESMGYTKKNMDEWIQKVRDGKVANEDFIDTLIKVGTKNGEVAKMANQSKDTWQAFTANVGNAFSRMSAGIIQSMDEIVSVATGGKFDSVNMLLAEKITPAIDKLTQSAKDWIKGHPDEIISFFNDLKSIDWGGLAKGFASGIGEIANAVRGIAKWANGKDLEGLGKFIFNLNIFGQGLLVVGGLLKGARGVIATIGTIGTWLVRGIEAGGIAKASSTLGKFVGFFKNFGKVGAAAETAAGVAGAGGAVTIGATIKGFIPAIEALAGVGAILTMASGIAALDTKLLSMAVNNMIKITGGMHQVFQNVKGLKADSFDGSALKNAVEQMFQMWEVFSGTGETVDAHGVKRGGGRSIAQMDKKLLSDMANSMKSMSSIIGSMTQMDVNMKALKGFKGFDEKITEGVTNFANALAGIYDAFDVAFGGDGGVRGKKAIDPTQAKSVSDIIASAESMFKSLNKITNVIPKLFGGLGNITKAPNGGMGKSPFSMVKDMLIGEDTTGGMFKDLHDIFQKATDDFDFDVSGFASKMQSALEAFRYIKRIGNQLSKMASSGNFADGAADGALSQIKTFISKLSTALDTDLIGDINFKIGSLQQSIDSIFIGLNNAVKNKEVTVSIKGDVTGDDELIRKINSARTRIENAVKNIPSSISKSVTISINPSVSIGKFHIPSIFGNTGGFIDGKHDHPIYRSKGGSVGIFKPKGKDVIPAMLAKGEYVMQKPAVDTFGVRFMQRINNMDIRGAMRELSARAGHIATVNRGVTNYITNNNNQQVTQHINTNNPNFAYKRSNRYVTAL